VGNWKLRVGKIKQVAHVYQNPWSPLWCAEVKAADFLDSCVSVDEAKLVAELAVRAWIEDLLYSPPRYDDIIFFNDGTD